MGHYQSVIVGLSLLLTCCAHQPSFAQQVDSAYRRWYNATCNAPRYTAIRIVPEIKECGIPDPKLQLVGPPKWWGCFYSDLGLIEISSHVPHETREQVIAHEMGHALNPHRHVDNGTGIMAAGVSSAVPYITKADIEMVCQENDCACQRPETP